ncbi:unnamed protein product [Rhizopus microsporus]
MLGDKQLLDRQIQEAKVLNAELAHLRPKAQLYERQVPSSNLFFLARDNASVKKKSEEYQRGLEKQRQELK